MKQIIVFDIGNVMADHRWKKLAEELQYDEHMTIRMRDNMFLNPLWSEFDRASLSDEEILHRMKAPDPSLSSYIDEVYLPENFARVIKAFPYSEELTKTLHNMGFPIYILSNFGRRLFSLVWNDFRFLQYVDGGILSADVKMLKPEKGIYLSLFEKYHIDPEDAVFFDDTPANIKAAKQLGMEAVLVGDRPFRDIAAGLKKHCGIILPQELYDKYYGTPQHL